MFFSKKSDLETINLVNQISILKTRMDNLELTIETLKTHINSLRGLVNRKINDLKIEEEGISKDINNTVILPDHGVPFRAR